MAVTNVKVEGMEKVLKNLNSRIGKIQDASLAGLWAAGLVIQGESMRLVPVEYGNLRGSAYTRRNNKIQIDKAEFAPKHALEANVIEVGYGAAYALFVHENMEQKLKGQPRPSGLGVYWGPSGAGPKFLEKAIRDNTNRILDVVRQYAGKGFTS